MDEFLHYTINWQTGELTFNDQHCVLEPKQVAVLKLLASANGQLVSYEEIQQAVWPDVVVAPNALQRIVAQLRKQLGDSAKAQKVIKTHPKRGYSLVINNTETLVPPKSSKLPKRLTGKKLTLTKLLLPILVFTTLLFLGSHFFAANKAQPHLINRLQPLDMQSDFFGNVVAISPHEFVFIDNQQSKQSLVKHNSQTNQKTVLIANIKVYGDITYNPHNNSILLGEIFYPSTSKIGKRKVGKQEIGQQKCAQLIEYSLNTHSKQTLLPCQNNFNHSPIMLASNKLVFSKTDKERNTELYLLNNIPNKGKQQVTAINAEPITQLAYHTASKQFAVQLQKTIYHAELQENNLVLIKPIFTTQESAPLPMLWLDNDTLLVVENTTNNGQLHSITTSGNTVSQQLQTTKQVTELTSLNQQIFAKLSRKNWQTNQRNLATSPTHSEVDKPIAPSIFADTYALYRPNSKDISLLSNRSGSQQLWLVQAQNIRQLTNTTFDIDHYLWLDSHHIAIIANKQLYTLAINTNDKDAAPLTKHYLASQYEPITLFQASNNQLLVKLKKQDDYVIGWLTTTGKVNVLYQGDLDWAQQLSDGTILANNSNKIMRLANGQLFPYQPLNHIKLQWRYVTRDNALYFQDKAQNIWRYLPSSKANNKPNNIQEKGELQQIGRYDIGSLFMTDYSTSNHSMLSDNFIGERNELVKLELTSQ